MRPLLLAGVPFGAAVLVALFADTLTIVTMALVDNAIILAIPGAMEAGLDEGLFWGSLAVALAIAFVVALPVSYLLIRSGRGHAVMHQYHNSGERT